MTPDKHQQLITPTRARWLFRLALAGIFAYFGLLALAYPVAQAGIWLSPGIEGIVESLMPASVFMIGMGAVQAAVAVAIVTRRFARYGLLAAALLLAGIIVNLGWSEIAIRDAVILTGVMYLYAQMGEES